jgi:hypothetical protein
MSRKKHALAKAGVDARFSAKDMRQRTSACPGKVDARFSEKDMRQRNIGAA